MCVCAFRRKKSTKNQAKPTGLLDIDPLPDCNENLIACEVHSRVRVTTAVFELRPDQQSIDYKPDLPARIAQVVERPVTNVTNYKVVGLIPDLGGYILCGEKCPLSLFRVQKVVTCYDTQGHGYDTYLPIYEYN